MFDIIFSIVHYGKQGLDTFDDGYVEYLLTAKLNQEAVHTYVAKKCRLLWTCAWFVFNRVETNGGSLQGRVYSGSGAPNENIVQNHLKIALLNVF